MQIPEVKSRMDANAGTQDRKRYRTMSITWKRGRDILQSENPCELDEADHVITLDLAIDLSCRKDQEMLYVINLPLL
jgi:hypothetical protein